MREIEFRGKSKATGKWIYGNLIVKKTKTNLATLENGEVYKYKYSIQYFTENGNSRTLEVEKDTIGQFVGENEYGRIYEGMKLYDENAEELCYVVYDNVDNEFSLEYDGWSEKAYSLDGLIIIKGDK